MGKTTFQMQLEAKEYKFSLKYPMYHILEGEFTIQKGQTVTKDLALKPAYGNMIIKSDPDEAEIRLDGELLNQKTTATLVKIPSGQHILTLSKDMYLNKIDTVNVTDDLTGEVFLELDANYGSVGIAVNPDAAILIDGKNADSLRSISRLSPGKYLARLSPGKHKVEALREKYYPELQEIIVYKGQEDKLNIQLRPVIGALSVMVDPPETSIYLNSIYYGMSPKLLDTLTIGEYNLELKKEGFATFRQHLLIEENKTIQINTALQQGKLIKVNTTPGGAEVYYNGVVAGTTPTEFVVKDGSNKLVIKKKYYADKEVFVTAEKDEQDFGFYLELNKTTVNILIETKPNQAGIILTEKVFLSEKSPVLKSDLPGYFGTSPYNLQVPIGKYDLKVEKKGYKPIAKEILIDKQEDYTLDLEPIKYRTKGNAILLSILWPGAGQSYLKRGSAHILMGIIGYGAAVYAVYEHGEATKNYDLYLVEQNPLKKESLNTEWKKNVDSYYYSLFTGAAVWGINFIWTLATQSEVKKYRNVQFSLLNSPNGSVPAVGWRSNF
jgi:hypothetical protein